MIQLSDTDKQWIKMCKFHYKDKYPLTGSWAQTLKPLFDKIYGWSSTEHYDDYLKCIFNKLLDIHIKIQDDGSGTNAQLRSIIGASFSKSMSYDDELPIERSIAALCGLIQFNKVIGRYELD